jgi:hypothetical protein
LLSLFSQGKRVIVNGENPFTRLKKTGVGNFLTRNDQMLSNREIDENDRVREKVKSD